MGQSKPYTKLSDVFGRSDSRDASRTLSIDHALSYFEQALLAVDAMNNEQREDAIKILTVWLMTDKFGPHARGVVHGLQKYAIADCLFENPTWEPPAGSRYLGI